MLLILSEPARNTEDSAFQLLLCTAASGDVGRRVRVSRSGKGLGACIRSRPLLSVEHTLRLLRMSPVMDRTFLSRSVCLFTARAPEPVKLEVAAIGHLCEGDKCLMADHSRGIARLSALAF